jgi:hypothetical protein
MKKIACLQLKAIHLALVTSHRKLEGSYEALRQERVRITQSSLLSVADALTL